MIIIVASLVGLFSFWLYIRFGFLYAALISTVALCVVPFQFSLAPLWERILLVLILGLLFFISLQTESDALEDFRKERKSILQACLFAGIYLTANLRIFAVAESWLDQTSLHLIPYAGFQPEIYWTSYVLIFLVPMAGLFLGIKKRKRALMNAAGIALAMSLATNKDYLGLKHYAWDPMIFGATLILAVILIIRWLAKGKNKERYGFTAESILKPERYGLSLTEIGAAVMPSVAIASPEVPPACPSPFEGGQSGRRGCVPQFLNGKHEKGRRFGGENHLRVSGRRAEPRHVRVRTGCPQSNAGFPSRQNIAVVRRVRSRKVRIGGFAIADLIYRKGFVDEDTPGLDGFLNHRH